MSEPIVQTSANDIGVELCIGAEDRAARAWASVVKVHKEKALDHSPGLLCSSRGGLEAIVDTAAHDIRMEVYVG